MVRFRSSPSRRMVRTRAPLLRSNASWREAAPCTGWPSTFIMMSPSCSPASRALLPRSGSSSATARPAASSSSPTARPTGMSTSAAQVGMQSRTHNSTARAARKPNFFIFSTLSLRLHPQYLICRKPGNSVGGETRKNMLLFLSVRRKLPPA